MAVIDEGLRVWDHRDALGSGKGPGNGREGMEWGRAVSCPGPPVKSTGDVTGDGA